MVHILVLMKRIKGLNTRLCNSRGLSCALYINNSVGSVPIETKHLPILNCKELNEVETHNYRSVEAQSISPSTESANGLKCTEGTGSSLVKLGRDEVHCTAPALFRLQGPGFHTRWKVCSLKDFELYKN